MISRQVVVAASFALLAERSDLAHPTREHWPYLREAYHEEDTHSTRYTRFNCRSVR
jgi:hypothetical protein